MVKINKKLRLFGLTFAINTIENLTLLFWFNVPISQKTIISVFILSLVLTFVIDKFILQKE